MAVILEVERKTAKARILLAFIYGLLILGGVTMVWPFLVMLASSFTGPYDYYRFSPVVRAVWDRDDRFMRYVSTCFQQFPAAVYPEAPAYWSSWTAVARDGAAARAFAARELAPLAKPETAAAYRRAAGDYADFNRQYDVRNSVCAFDPRDVAPFVQRRYERLAAERGGAAFAGLSRAGRRDEALRLLNREWAIRYTSFYGIRMVAQQRAPLNHATWDYPAGDGKWETYQDFKRAYRERLAPEESPMTRTRPFESRPLWVAYLRRADVQERLGFDRRHLFTPADYARLSGKPCASFSAVPFPLPAGSAAALARAWESFIRDSYPRRLLRLRQPDGSLAPYRPGEAFAKIAVQSAEQSWQGYLLKKYGTLAAVNRACGWKLDCIEEARLPFREALAVTFERRGWREFWSDATSNYRTVADYLFLRGRAFGNTVLLVVLSILATLTVNPLAAYALSRLGMRVAEKALLFLLATMAFPAAVTAIPGFLLIRDLGLLNTFAALVLPTLANGMSIFILKGFFDALPRELYEAAAIDGAREWQVFWRITLPMTTPILAVNALTAFVTAYNSWEWALLVCQKKSNWTLAVWMYQMSQEFGNQPWAVMAGFVLVSIPTAVVFIACQKIILRGIVLPSMK